MPPSLEVDATPWRRVTDWWRGVSGRVRLGAAAVLVAALVTTLAVQFFTGGEEGGVATAPPPSPTPTTAQTGEAGPPTRLVVPALDVDAPVSPIEMDTKGVLTPPSDVDTVGWWQRSARPGADRGQTLVTGHSLREGDGAMDHIGDLEPGDDVELHSRGSVVSYEATKVVTLTRDQVAERAVELFGQQRKDGRLVLVTCTDWDGDVWKRNVIVFADRQDADAVAGTEPEAA